MSANLIREDEVPLSRLDHLIQIFFIHDGLCIEQWVKGFHENVSNLF